MNEIYLRAEIVFLKAQMKALESRVIETVFTSPKYNMIASESQRAKFKENITTELKADIARYINEEVAEIQKKEPQAAAAILAHISGRQ